MGHPWSEPATERNRDDASCRASTGGIARLYRNGSAGAHSNEATLTIAVSSAPYRGPESEPARERDRPRLGLRPSSGAARERGPSPSSSSPPAPSGSPGRPTPDATPEPGTGSTAPAPSVSAAPGPGAGQIDTLEARLDRPRRRHGLGDARRRLRATGPDHRQPEALRAGRVGAGPIVRDQPGRQRARLRRALHWPPPVTASPRPDFALQGLAINPSSSLPLGRPRRRPDPTRSLRRRGREGAADGRPLPRRLLIRSRLVHLGAPRQHQPRRRTDGPGPRSRPEHRRPGLRPLLPR